MTTVSLFKKIYTKMIFHLVKVLSIVLFCYYLLILNLYFNFLIYSGNCKKANRCLPLAWSSWTPAISNGQCKDQTRYQDKRAEYVYQMKQDNCHGINPDCNPGRINDKRTFCKFNNIIFMHPRFHH